MIFPLPPLDPEKYKSVRRVISYGYADKEYFDLEEAYHNGWDCNYIINGKACDVDLGLPFTAAATGRVIYLTDRVPRSTWGGMIVMEHKHLNLYSIYAHHQPGSARVRVGHIVDSGQPLAAIGRMHSKNPRCAHLHFGFSKYLSDWSLWPGKRAGLLATRFYDPEQVFDYFNVWHPRVPHIAMVKANEYRYVKAKDSFSLS